MHWRNSRNIQAICFGVTLILVLGWAALRPPIIALSSKAESSPQNFGALPIATQTTIASAQGGKLFAPPRGDTRLVVISDLNSAYGSTSYEPEVTKALQLMPFWQPDMVICSGDMVAGQKSTLSEEQIQAMWTAFDQQIMKPLRETNMPYGFTLGNHDASSALGPQKTFLFAKERNLAAEYWQAPQHDPGLDFIDRQDFPFYYTFKFQDIFFLAWDGSSDYIPPEKLDWVEQALSSPEARQAKLRILLGHLPLYAVAVGRNKPGEVMRNADALRALLEKYDVHTYISGHHHAYYPAHRGNLQLLHTGNLGAGPRSLIDSNLPRRQTITVLDIFFDLPEKTVYTTYDLNTLDVIAAQQLPRFLMGHNGILLRRDVAAKDLTPAEKANCNRRLDGQRCQP
ncbi:MAG: hypothetical protein RLZZ568_2209 [Cyanobacteriota bacterium]